MLVGWYIFQLKNPFSISLEVLLLHKSMVESTNHGLTFLKYTIRLNEYLGAYKLALTHSICHILKLLLIRLLAQSL